MPGTRTTTDRTTRRPSTSTPARTARSGARSRIRVTSSTPRPRAAAIARRSSSRKCARRSRRTLVPDPAGNGYYPVYSDVKRGNAGYCAWHSAGSCGRTTSVPVQFAFFFNLDGDAGCDPQDTQTGHSQGLAALANVTAHELSEARSDPAQPRRLVRRERRRERRQVRVDVQRAVRVLPERHRSGSCRASGRTRRTPPARAIRTRQGQKGCLDGH